MSECQPDLDSPSVRFSFQVGCVWLTAIVQGQPFAHRASVPALMVLFLRFIFSLFYVYENLIA